MSANRRIEKETKETKGMETEAASLEVEKTFRVAFYTLDNFFEYDAAGNSAFSGRIY